MTTDPENNKFDPESIQIESLSKSFEYERIARELDECKDPEDLRLAAKCFLKLYMKTTETVRGF